MTNNAPREALPSLVRRTCILAADGKVAIVCVGRVTDVFMSADQSSTFNFISSELAFSSGAYIAHALAGKALNLPGISARIR